MSDRTRNPQLILFFSFALAWGFDFLFWKKMPGISFPLFVVLALSLGFWLARRVGANPSRRSLWLLVPLALFLAVNLFRLEPFSRLLSVVAVCGLLAILSVSFLGGRWPQYGLIDFVTRFAILLPFGLQAYRERNSEQKANGEDEGGLRRLAPVGRGLLLALPILWILSALLSSADAYFAQWLENLFGLLRIEKLPEYLLRGFYILILGYGAMAVYHYALYRSQDERLPSEGKALLKPFIGFGETATVLVSVELLLLAFVLIQFRYFFGGGANIAESTFTYAEYARRGFTELVVVVVLSVGLFAALSAAGRRETASQQRRFSYMGIGLFLLVAVMLVSAYQRLLLYESVYGFTRLRTMAHVFMIWLGLLLVALVVLEALQRQRAFALAALATALGFAASLGLLNVDAFIVKANVEQLKLGYSLDEPTDERSASSEPFDSTYLASLSEDALPAMLEAFKEAGSAGDSEIRDAMLRVIGCHAVVHEEYASPPAWQSFHFSRQRAQNLWAEFRQSEGFQSLTLEVGDDAAERSVLIDGQAFDCQPQAIID